MSTSDQPTALQFRNLTSDTVRLQVSSGGRIAWEEWIPPSGIVHAPAFPPPRIDLEARITTAARRVTYTSFLENTPACGAIHANLEQRSGALLFALTPGPMVAVDTLRLSNSTIQALEFVLRFPRSPFALAGIVKPRDRLDLHWPALELCVVRNGVTTTRMPVPGTGAWSIVDLERGCAFVEEPA